MNGKTMTDRKVAASSLLPGLAAGDAPGVPREFRLRGSFHCKGMSGCGTHNQPSGTLV
jgi:ADP-ribosylglycohydrolase